MSRAMFMKNRGTIPLRPLVLNRLYVGVAANSVPASGDLDWRKPRVPQFSHVLAPPAEILPSRVPRLVVPSMLSLVNSLRLDVPLLNRVVCLALSVPA